MASILKTDETFILLYHTHIRHSGVRVMFGTKDLNINPKLGSDIMHELVLTQCMNCKHICSLIICGEGSNKGDKRVYDVTEKCIK